MWTRGSDGTGSRLREGDVQLHKLSFSVAQDEIRFCPSMNSSESDVEVSGSIQSQKRNGVCV